jgi:hypothetical protein
MKAARPILAVCFLALCWMGMQAVHELGHVLAAYATGGTVERVVLHPLTISRTDLSHNPHPLVVAWAGPILGVLFPLICWGGFYLGRLRGEKLLRFFAGFCLIANGAYLGFGSVGRVGDAGDLLRHGTLPSLLWVFGGVAIGAGFALWHSLGPRLGLQRRN